MALRAECRSEEEELQTYGMPMTSMLATSESELQEMMDRIEGACKKYELQINSEKTKVMTTSETSCNIRCGNSVLEQVDNCR